MFFSLRKKTSSIIYPKCCWAFPLVTLFVCLLVDVFSVCVASSSTTQSGPSDILTFHMWGIREFFVELTMILNILIVLRHSPECLISRSVSLYAIWLRSVFHMPLRWWWFLVVGFGWLNKPWCWELTVADGPCGTGQCPFLCILLLLTVLHAWPSIPPV